MGYYNRISIPLVSGDLGIFSDACFKHILNLILGVLDHICRKIKIEHASNANQKQSEDHVLSNLFPGGPVGIVESVIVIDFAVIGIMFVRYWRIIDVQGFGIGKTLKLPYPSYLYATDVTVDGKTGAFIDKDELHTGIEAISLITGSIVVFGEDHTRHNIHDTR